MTGHLAKKHNGHLVVLPIVVETRGVIPKQKVASLAQFKARGFDCRRQHSYDLTKPYGRNSSRPVKDKAVGWGARVLSV
jgi:hypothetical protein